MANQETFVTNAAESTLSAAAAVGATTLNVTSTAAFPAVPFYATVDPSVDAKREVVLATGKTATTLTVTRAQDNTADVAHDSGAVIAVVPVAALWTDINDRVDATAATVVTDHGGLTGLADDDHTHYLTATRHDAHDHSTALGTATAADLPNVPAGNIAATTVQAAINELDTEKSATTHNHDTVYTKAQAGGQNIWVQATAPTAVATGDLWIDTA